MKCVMTEREFIKNKSVGEQSKGSIVEIGSGKRKRGRNENTRRQIDRFKRKTKTIKRKRK